MEERYTCSLPEVVLLAAIDEASGALRGAAELRYGLAGAILIELGWRGRLRGDVRGIAAADQLRVGDPLLDDALRIMRQAGAARPVRSWLLRITRAMYDVQERYLARLVQGGVIRQIET